MSSRARSSTSEVGSSGEYLPEAEREAAYRGSAGIDRLLGFSNAVFAFAMTFLVGQLALPIVAQDKASTELAGQLANLLPRLVSVMIGFTVAATYWAAYHRIYNYIARYDNLLFTLNFALLFLIALQPFATNLLGHYGYTSTAVMAYAGLLALTGLVILLLWWHVTWGRRLLIPDVNPVVVRHHLWRAAAAPILFALSVPLALLSPLGAEISWVSIAIATYALNRIYRPKY